MATTFDPVYPDAVWQVGDEPPIGKIVLTRDGLLAEVVGSVSATDPPPGWMSKSDWDNWTPWNGWFKIRIFRSSESPLDALMQNPIVAYPQSLRPFED